MNHGPYVEVNRAMSEPFMVGMLPLGLIGPIAICLFISYLLTQVLWVILFGSVSYFWTIGLFFWLSATYYTVVGDQPWRIKNQLSWMPTYRRGLYPAKPLLDRPETTDTLISTSS